MSASNAGNNNTCACGPGCACGPSCGCCSLASPRPLLRSLPTLAKVGVACLLAVVLGGLVASASHLWHHYQNRDEQPGLSMTDLEGAYHGSTSTSPLLAKLRAGHPDELAQSKLAPADKDALIKWLTTDRIAENYDNLDLGDSAPSELLARSCVQCHSRAMNAKSGSARVPLETWADVKPLAFSNTIKPADIKVMIASTHAHALSLAPLLLVLGALLWLTGTPRVLAGTLIALMGVGLFADLGGWWIARSQAWAVPMIVAGGCAFTLSAGLSIALVLLELVKCGCRAKVVRPGAGG